MLFIDKRESGRHPSFVFSSNLGVKKHNPGLAESVSFDSIQTSPETMPEQQNPAPSGSEGDESVAFTVRYPASHLQRLRSLEATTGIDARQWLKALLPALLQRWESHGELTVPLAVVTLREAIDSGLLPPSLERPPEE